MIYHKNAEQFKTMWMEHFLSKWKVNQQAYGPDDEQYDSPAGTNMRKLKLLVQECGHTKSEKYSRGLMELRNARTKNGESPAQIMFGRELKLRELTHWTDYKSKWLKCMTRQDRVASEYAKKQAVKNDNDQTEARTPVQKGDEVLIQNMRTQQWDRSGTVMGIGKSQDCQIKTSSGRVVWRSRQFLKKIK